MKLWELSGSKLAIAGILAFIMLSGLILIRVGVFSIDESTILLGFDGLSKSGKLKIFNDFESFQVPELNAYKGVVNGDELYVSYPPLYFYLLLPIYVALGPLGLILTNLISAAIAVLVFSRLMADITGNESLALKAALLLVFTTFFFEYSLAIWPHMFAIMLTLVAVYLFRTGIAGEGSKEYMFLYSGIFLGFATGIRSASLIFLVLMVFLIIWEKKYSLKRLGLIVLGSYAPIGLISFINFYRFNTINPIANDIASKFKLASVNRLVPVIVILSSIYFIFVHWFIKSKPFKDKSYKKGRKQTKKYILYLLLASGGLIILAMVIFKFDYFYQYGRNFIGYFFNSYFLPKLPYEGATFTEPGVISYLGVIKKAVLQSCPFMILMFAAPYILGKFSELKRFDKRLISIFCFGIPLFYAFFNFHGGMGFNSRYYLELLPWGIIVTVLWIERTRITSQLVEVFVFTIVFFALVLSFMQDSTLISKLIVIVVPSIVAILLLAHVVLGAIFPKIQYYNTIVSFLIVISLSIGFSFEYFKDLPTVLSRRSDNFYKAKIVEKTLPDRAFLFVFWGFKDPMAAVKLKKQIIVADYNLSPGGNPFPFIEKALTSGIPVYLYGEGIHPELMEVLKVEYNVNDISKELIPIYQITRKGRMF